MLIHYHIEKTAGSSFRDICYEYFGVEACSGLYGKDSKSTTDDIRALAYPEGRVLKMPERADVVARHLLQCRPAFFTSHTIRPIRARLPDDLTSVAFFREPVARLVSHYNHWKMAGYFTGSFRDFYQTEKFCNWQARSFSIEEMEKLTCVGVTERFSESLSLINDRLGLELASRHKNKTPWRPFQINAKTLDDEVRSEILRLNQRDVELYAAVLRRFERDTPTT